MSLNDINFQEGDGQAFLLELPIQNYSGPVNDILIETSGSQLLLLEAVSASSIFIMSE